jgi:hypothetical protein
MAKSINEESVQISVEEFTAQPQAKPTSNFKVASGDEFVSCLRNEKIVVRYATKPNKNITDSKHELYGGMANGETRTFTVQMLRNGQLSNTLTDSEKLFLENYMGLEHNALSIYLKKDNYWRGYQVRLSKSDNILDLSIPEDFIKYKVLLTNKDLICPSLKEFKDSRKETYQFYMISEGEEINQTNQSMTSKMEAMLELGKILENKSLLKVVVEIMNGRPISKSSKLDMIQAEAFKSVDANPKLFLSVAKDPYIKTKVLMAECLEHGLIISRSGLYYLPNGEPLCEGGEDSTLAMAAKYLNSPKRQEIKLTLEAKLKLKKD